MPPEMEVSTWMRQMRGLISLRKKELVIVAGVCVTRMNPHPIFLRKVQKNMVGPMKI